MTAADKEEFNTQQYPGPGLPAERPNLDLGRMTVPPPPPPPPNLRFRRRRSPHRRLWRRRPFPTPRRRKAMRTRYAPGEEERKKWERLRAGQLIADGGSPCAVGQCRGEREQRQRRDLGCEEDGNRRFLATAGSAGLEKSVATKNDRIDALVAQGTIIRADLLTAIQSDLPGNVSAIVREDVWSFDGRRVLIPAGTKLIGDYRSGANARPNQNLRRMDPFVAGRRRIGATRLDRHGRSRQGGAGRLRRPALYRALRRFDPAQRRRRRFAIHRDARPAEPAQQSTEQLAILHRSGHRDNDDDPVATKPEPAQCETDRFAASFSNADEARRGSLKRTRSTFPRPFMSTRERASSSS